MSGGFHRFGPDKPLIDNTGMQSFCSGNQNIYLARGERARAVSDKFCQPIIDNQGGKARPQYGERKSRQYYASHDKGPVIAVQRMLFDVNLSAEVADTPTTKDKGVSA